MEIESRFNSLFGQILRKTDTSYDTDSDDGEGNDTFSNNRTYAKKGLNRGTHESSRTTSDYPGLSRNRKLNYTANIQIDDATEEQTTPDIHADNMYNSTNGSSSEDETDFVSYGNRSYQRCTNEQSHAIFDSEPASDVKRNHEHNHTEREQLKSSLSPFQHQKDRRSSIKQEDSEPRNRPVLPDIANEYISGNKVSFPKIRKEEIEGYSVVYANLANENNLDKRVVLPKITVRNKSQNINTSDDEDDDNKNFNKSLQFLNQVNMLKEKLTPEEVEPTKVPTITSSTNSLNNPTSMRAIGYDKKDHKLSDTVKIGIGLKKWARVTKLKVKVEDEMKHKWKANLPVDLKDKVENLRLTSVASGSQFEMRTGLDAFNYADPINQDLMDKKVKRNQLSITPGRKVKTFVDVVKVARTAFQCGYAKDHHGKVQRAVTDAASRFHKGSVNAFVRIEFNVTNLNIKPCGMTTWAIRKYQSATENIRFDVPMDLSTLRDISPLEYVTKYIKIEKDLKNYYKKTFLRAVQQLESPKISSKSKNTTTASGVDPNLEAQSKLPSEFIFPALEKLFYKNLGRGNYRTVYNFIVKYGPNMVDNPDDVILETPTYKDASGARRKSYDGGIDIDSFCGLAAFCERRYWIMWANVDEDYLDNNHKHGSPYGCRSHLEYLDYRGMGEKLKVADVPMYIQSVVMSAF